jgi:hypothetical protein
MSIAVEKKRILTASLLSDSILSVITDDFKVQVPFSSGGRA